MFKSSCREPIDRQFVHFALQVFLDRCEIAAPHATPQCRPSFPSEPIRGEVVRIQRDCHLDVMGPLIKGLTRCSKNQVDGHIGASLSGNVNRGRDVLCSMVSLQQFKLSILK